MAADPTQRVGDNAFHLPASWLPDSKWLQGRSERYNAASILDGTVLRSLKRIAVLQSLLIICISTALVVVAWAEPSPTPSHIISRIPRQSVQSSAIAKVGYSKRRHILEIEFVNGAVYRYFDIPLSVHRDLMSAESKARFYDSNIRKHYRSVLVRPRQKEQPTPISKNFALFASFTALLEHFAIARHVEQSETSLVISVGGSSRSVRTRRSEAR